MTRDRRIPRGWAWWPGALISDAIAILLLLGPVADQRWWTGFRAYFSNDQMSYAAIAANVAAGNPPLVEPFTLTGTSYYPSGWYLLIGVVSRVTSVPVYALWTFLGLGVVLAAVTFLCWLVVRVSDRPWTAVLPGLALMTGTGATVTAGAWFAGLGRHAVTWGPFGSLFTLNGEVAALSIAVIAMGVLLLALGAVPGLPSGHRSPVVMALVVAALVGLLANVHTYTFFSVTFLVATLLAVRTLLTDPSRVRLATTLVVLAVALTVGPRVADAISPLAVFALVLVAALPAAWPILRRRARLALACTAVFVVAASPQVVRTVVGLAAGDPFLVYREASSQDLGVPPLPGLVAAAPLVLALAWCIVAAAGRTRPVLLALPISLGVGWLLLSANDHWGFDQEPYRFWLQFEILTALLLTPVLAWSVSHWPSGAARRPAAMVLAGATIGAWVVALPDVAGFWSYARTEGIVALEGPRPDALRTLLADHQGLVMSSACQDPRALKLIWPGPVAYYNAGLAWPTNEKDFRIFQDPGTRSEQDPLALRVARVTGVVTDSACADEWVFPADQRVIAVSRQTYPTPSGTQEFTLWRVQDG